MLLSVRFKSHGIKVFIAFFAIHCFLFLKSAGQDIKIEQGAANEYLLSIDELPILIDSLNILEFEDIQERQDEFQIHSGFQPKDYSVEYTYWVKVSLSELDKSGKKWMIEFYDQTIDSITAFIPRVDGTYHSETVGDAFPFGSKGFAHKNFEWLLDSEIKGTQELYFEVKSHAYADIRLAVRTINRFVYYSLSEYFLYGIFYGMIFIISLYNILIFFAIKERKYLFYTFYIASVGIYAMCVDGIAFQYLWPNSPNWNQIAFGAALFSLIFWSLLFSKRFLNTSVRAPLLNKVLTGLILIRSVLFLYALFFDHQVFEYRNIEIIPLTVIFYTSIHVWMKGYKPARFFVVAYGMLFLGFLIKALLYTSVIPFVILSYYSLHVCFLLEMLFLTFALSDRVRILKANRDRALKRIIVQHQENAELKDKVNKELEEKIEKRTRELEEKNLLLAKTNQQLYEQTQEINKMNSKLDLDNWKLKNNMKQILQDRLINKNLTHDQFKEVFPNEIACYRFLERLKWNSGYHCVKCGNHKYSEGTTKFSRRCTKCGYVESITSNTVFHRVKFPIEKAFYILYVTINRENEFTLDELSELLSLRRSTVWSFRKKVEKLYGSKDGKYSADLVNSLFAFHVN